MSEGLEMHEAPEKYAPQTANLPRRYRITPENAREMAARGHEAKKRIAQEQEEEMKRLEKLAAMAPEPPDEYVREQVTRTRAQIEKVRKKLDHARSARDIKALSEALWRLSEVERVLAGRPLPTAPRHSRSDDRSRPAPVNPLE